MKYMDYDHMKVDAEMVHNWPTRYMHVTAGQLGELSDEVRAALLRAHRAHNRKGENAQELAEKVAAQFPDALYA